jgi:hypothetical protein
VVTVPNATITDILTATETFGQLLADGCTKLTVQDTMVKAETFGSKQAKRGILVIHDGYVRNADEFNAGTAMYRIQYS